jgi:formate dehydrogenase subunit delta
MIIEKLVRMANQIAANFEFGGNKAKAVSGAAEHLSRYWTSGMRAEIIQHYENGGAGLSEIAALVVAKLADETSDAA